MTKNEMKAYIAENFGFAKGKIEIIDSYIIEGTVIQIRFKVCNVNYTVKDGGYIEATPIR